MAPCALCKQRVLSAQLHAGHIAILGGAIGTYAHIANQNAAYHIIFNDDFLSGKTRKYFNAQRFRLLGQPAAQVACANHVASQFTPGVVHALGYQRIGDFLRLFGILQQIDIVTRGGRIQGSAALFPVGKQLRQGAGFEYRARQNMRSHFRSLLDHANG